MFPGFGAGRQKIAFLGSPETQGAFLTGLRRETRCERGPHPPSSRAPSPSGEGWQAAIRSPYRGTVFLPLQMSFFICRCFPLKTAACNPKPLKRTDSAQGALKRCFRVLGQAAKNDAFLRACSESRRKSVGERPLPSLTKNASIFRQIHLPLNRPAPWQCFAGRGFRARTANVLGPQPPSGALGKAFGQRAGAGVDFPPQRRPYDGVTAEPIDAKKAASSALGAHSRHL